MSAFRIDIKKDDSHSEPSADLNGIFVNNERGFVPVCKYFIKFKPFIIKRLFHRYRCEWYALAEDLTNEVHGLGIDDLHSVTAQLLSSQPLSSSDETSLSIDDPLNYPLISVSVSTFKVVRLFLG